MLDLRCTLPMTVWPCLTNSGVCSRHRTWYQCVRGCVGAVDNQTVVLTSITANSSYFFLFSVVLLLVHHFFSWLLDCHSHHFSFKFVYSLIFSLALCARQNWVFWLTRKHISFHFYYTKWTASQNYGSLLLAGLPFIIYFIYLFIFIYMFLLSKLTHFITQILAYRCFHLAPTNHILLTHVLTQQWRNGL